MAAPMTAERLLAVARETIRAAEYCFLITQDRSGQVSTRLMQPFDPEPDLTIWMGASPKSRKVRQIREDGRATLAYQDKASNAYAVLSGSAAIVDDPAQRRHYWREGWEAFFKQGPEGEDYVLIRFTPNRIELMNFAQEVAPEPYGLRPAVLLRQGEGWVVAGEEAG